MELATYLSQQKKTGGMTLTGLARRAKVGVSHLHDIKSGRRRPSLAIAVRIEEATGGQVSPRDMLGDVTPNAAPENDQHA